MSIALLAIVPLAFVLSLCACCAHFALPAPHDKLAWEAAFSGPAGESLGKVGSPTEHQSIYLGAEDYAPLCAELVVDKPEGLMLQLAGVAEPWPQDCQLDVVEAEQSKQLVLRAHLNETEERGGILLETSQQRPVAVLRTQCAVAPVGEQLPASSRHVPLVRAGGQAGPPMAVVESVDGSSCHFSMRHCTSAGSPGAVILHVFGDGNGGMNIANVRGDVVATAGPAICSRRSIQLCQGTDVALVVAMLLAVEKLK